MPQQRDSSRQPHEHAIPAQRDQHTGAIAQPAPTVPLMLVPVGQAQNGQGRGEHSRYWPPTADWALVVVTALLMFYTALLYYSTRKLAIEAAKTADASGEDAAKNREVMAAQQIAMETSALAAQTLAKATEASVAAMKDTASQQLRAYLGVYSQPIRKAAKAGERPFTEFKLTNFGATPAHDIRVKAACYLSAIPHTPADPEPPFSAEPGHGGFILDPHQERVVGGRAPMDLTSAQLQALDADTDDDGRGYRLCMRGQVSYIDIFGTTHVRHFCHLYGGAAGAAGDYCGVHNVGD